MEHKNLQERVNKEISDNEAKLRNYVRLLKAANEFARLTGPSDEETLWNGHVLDCAHILPLINDGESVIDVGTGGGLPGIVIAVCRPKSKVVMLDSISRKCALLEKIVFALGLRNAEVVCDRSETYAAKRREKFSVVTARAVSATGVLAEILVPLVKVGGRIIAFKGPKALEETDSIGNRWHELGLSAPKFTSYGPDGMDRYLLTWDKKRPAPKGIPRRPGMAEKFPWYERARPKKTRRGKKQNRKS